MKILRILLLAIFVVGLLFSFAFAAGNVEKGKALFDDPKAFSGSGEKSCSSCHPDGKGLEKSGMMGKKEWKNPVGTFKSLEETINSCIIEANKGKAIDPKLEEMKNVVAYIKSLHKGKAKEMKEEMMQKKEEMKEKMPEKKMEKKTPGY